MENGAHGRKADFALTETRADPLRLSGLLWDSWTYIEMGFGQERQIFLLQGQGGSPGRVNLNIKQSEV